MARRVAVLVFDRFQILDAAGPISAFEMANTLAARSYDVCVRAVSAGLVESSSGTALWAHPLPQPSKLDTLLVVGGVGARGAAQCPRTRRLVQRSYARGLRVASVCSGTYVLASAGILDGKRATTHWSRTKDFSARFPNVKLDSDCIYVSDGNVWTSAGISAGIDLTLALITADLGETVARQVAQELVVYYRRPGGQSQFSPLLNEHAGGRFEGLFDFIRANLKSDLSVPCLAKHVGMSPRHFSRLFTSETGIGPAGAVQRIRVEAARVLLENKQCSIKETAAICGFGSGEHLRRALHRHKVRGTAR